jgi:hypothetical protein
MILICNPRLLKLQSSIAGVKTPCFEAFFMSLESYWSVNVENGLTWAIGHLQHKLWQRKGWDSRPLKVRNQPDHGVCRWSATHRWKAFKESYKFPLDLILIGGLSKELWTHKVMGVQTGTVLGLLLGSPETKSHSDVGAAE